jgi:hypothetical protein
VVVAGEVVSGWWNTFPSGVGTVFAGADVDIGNCSKKEVLGRTTNSALSRNGSAILYISIVYFKPQK